MLRAIEALIRRARGALAAVEAVGADGYPGGAVAYLDRASDEVTAAARRLSSRYQRPDGRMTLLGSLVQEWPVALIVGLAAFVARLMLGLPAVVTVVVVLVVLFGASALWVPARRGRERLNESRFAARWRNGTAVVDVTGSDGLAQGLASIDEARRQIGGMATAHLAGLASLGLTGPSIVVAAHRDAILRHLHRADLKLCQSYEAATRGSGGDSA